MSNANVGKQFDLEERTFHFAKDVALFSRQIPRTIANFEYLKQAIRSSGSVGANYIEARESLSKKDFLHRLKLCRKEAKETAYWLRLLNATNTSEAQPTGGQLYGEANELKKIFSAIILKA